jgi:hypothetical protein
MSYPSFISGIYTSVQQLYRLHFDQCEHIPQELKDKVQALRENNTSNRGGRKQYWINSAKRRGLVDTSFGVHFGCDPNDPIPPIELNDEADVELADVEFGMDGNPLGEDGYPMIPVDDVEVYPLVLPEDRGLITDYLYLAMEQMQPCSLVSL